MIRHFELIGAVTICALLVGVGIASAQEAPALPVLEADAGSQAGPSDSGALVRNAQAPLVVLTRRVSPTVTDRIHVAGERIVAILPPGEAAPDLAGKNVSVVIVDGLGEVVVVGTPDQIAGKVAAYMGRVVRRATFK